MDHFPAPPPLHGAKTISFYERVTRECRKIVDGKPCGAQFVGPRTRKYCDAHSARVKYSGKG